MWRILILLVFFSISNGKYTTEKPCAHFTTVKPSEFECPEKDGIFADPENCAAFYQCYRCNPTKMCCPKDCKCYLVYDRAFQFRLKFMKFFVSNRFDDFLGVFDRNSNAKIFQLSVRAQIQFSLFGRTLIQLFKILQYEFFCRFWRTIDVQPNIRSV